MSFTVIDLGASSTRFCSDTGNVAVTANNMVFLNTLEPSLLLPDATDVESSLEVLINKDDTSNTDVFPANVLIGLMAEKHRNVNERPSVNKHKHLQRINFISAVVQVALCRLKGEVGENVDLYLAVPPVEVNDAKEVFEKVLLGSYSVTFPKYMGGVVTKFTINSVSCYEESYMAVTSFFFNMNGTVKEEARKYLTGTVLSLDIGASTTDLAIIKKGRYLDKSGQTYRIGGNVARDNLTDLVCQRYAIDLPIEDAEKTMAEGRLQQGNGYVDVSDLVNIAKQDLAKQLTTYMQTYFKRVNIPIQMINAIIVSGGGSLQSQYANEDGEIIKTSEPMSYYVTQELTDWSNGTEVVQYGGDARFANVKGLFIRAKVDSLKKEQQRMSESLIQQTQPMASAQPVQQIQTVVNQQTQPVNVSVNSVIN